MKGCSRRHRQPARPRLHRARGARRSGWPPASIACDPTSRASCWSSASGSRPPARASTTTCRRRSARSRRRRSTTRQPRRDRLPLGGVDGTSARDMPEESLMLTGDENIIDIQFVVLWQISDAGKYLFNIRDPDDDGEERRPRARCARSSARPSSNSTLHRAAAAEIEARTQQLIQHILDSYGAGIVITRSQLQKVDPPDAGDRGVPRRAGARAPTRSGCATRRRPIATTSRSAPKARRSRSSRQAEAYRAEKIALATATPSASSRSTTSIQGEGRSPSGALSRDDGRHPARA